MKTLVAGEVFRGKSYADMINKAIGTSFTGYLKSGVNLRDFGCPDVIAWFVYMDGSTNGYDDGWIWKNDISKDGKLIREYNVSKTLEHLNYRRMTTGYKPYRLAFQIDPYQNGEKHCCKFVGAFRFKSFLNDNSSGAIYERVINEFRLLGKGETGGNCHTKESFIPTTGNFVALIDDMNFDQRTLSLLQSWGIQYANQLLELEFPEETTLAQEIQKKLYEYFKQDDSSISRRGATMADFYKMMNR